MSIWPLFILSIVASWILSGALRRYALKNSLLDLPNERSSHSLPTPRGGGVAIVVTFITCMIILYVGEYIARATLIGVVGAGLVVALIGFWDDHGHISARWRLLAHLVAAVWGVYWFGGFPSIVLWGDIGLDLHWLGHFLAVIYLVWLLNLYNFMDGIDGIASIEAVTVLASSVLLFWLFVPNAESWIVNLILLCSVLGFLAWNFPPAKIFMGDAGSGFLGIVLGLLSIQAAGFNPDFFWAWLILLGAFIVDATVTLVRRVFRGEKFYEAHRSHAYQYASRKFAAHKPITLAVGFINLFWLFPMALLVMANLLNGLVALMIAYMPLVYVAYLLKAGDRVSQKDF
jgi:Fuc2NAc and GlcNAc transferase